MMRARRAHRDDPKAVTDLARRLGGLLAELGLSEIEVTTGDTRIRLSRALAAPAVSGAPSPAAVTTASPPPAHVADALSFTGITIEAPMVGTFYRASSPTAEPYVREGDVVKEGQILCIIEAMKLMNEIETRAGGRIAKILVENGQAVEYGQPLFLIDPLR
jgi:acetyl-CoA carboxylase biotin carboxyl carrier protein